MNRFVRRFTLLVGLPMLMASALAVITLAQEEDDPAGTSGAAALDNPDKAPKDIFTETQKFTEIYQYIRKMYFRPVDERVLLNGAIEGLLQAVDRNNSFVPDSKTLLGNEEPFERSTKGLGLVLGFTSLRDYGSSVPVVLSVLPESPAAKAGVRAESVLWQVGDRAVVNGEMLARNLYDLLDRPAEGKKVSLVLYDPVEGRRELELTPGETSLPRKLESKESEDGILQVRFPLLLSDSTVKELGDLLKKNSEVAQKGLILDLRNSSLGDATVGYSLADLFIRDGATLGKILIERGEKKLLPKRDNRGGEIVFRADDGVAMLDFPVVVLVDFTTSGPAEILAGALKHAGRGRIVGEKSFGYAVFRERFVFERGAQIYLTTGLPSTGSNKVYMGEGVEPDVKVQPAEGEDMLAAALEDEGVAPEDVGTKDAEAEAEKKDKERQAAIASAENRLLDAAVKEVQRLRSPAKTEANPKSSDKSSKEVG